MSKMRREVNKVSGQMDELVESIDDAATELDAIIDGSCELSFEKITDVRAILTKAREALYEGVNE